MSFECLVGSCYGERTNQTEAEPGGYPRQIGGDTGEAAELGCDPAPAESCDSGASGLNPNTTSQRVTSSCFCLHFQKLIASPSLILLQLCRIPRKFDLSTDTWLQLLKFPSNCCL